MLGRCGKYYHWNCLQGYTYRVVSGRVREVLARLESVC